MSKTLPFLMSGKVCVPMNHCCLTKYSETALWSSFGCVLLHDIQHGSNPARGISRSDSSFTQTTI
ncbi:MAG: hypothetical protein LBC74_15050 [Planctomycetaceae bacterium]|nr:hypothetical protein [Planctomycetaceae bacterium]